jgi:hypothetical protein
MKQSLLAILFLCVLSCKKIDPNYSGTQIGVVMFSKDVKTPKIFNNKSRILLDIPNEGCSQFDFNIVIQNAEGKIDKYEINSKECVDNISYFTLENTETNQLLYLEVDYALLECKITDTNDTYASGIILKLEKI